MVNINEPVLNAAHARSMNNRPLIEAGGACACFHCLSTFDAGNVQHWTGKGNTTALCPICRYDTVLSSRVDPIDTVFLQHMQAHFFEQRTKLDLTEPQSQPAK